MIEPFLITNNLMGYVDGSIPCPSKTLFVTDGFSVPKENPNYPIWVSNDAHVYMLIISIILEASFRHVQGTTSRDLWLSKAYAPHSISREYTLKTQLLRIKMLGDETPDAYLNCAQEYADALKSIGEHVKDKISLCLMSHVFVKNITVLKLQSLPVKVQLHLASFMSGGESKLVEQQRVLGQMSILLQVCALESARNMFVGASLHKGRFSSIPIVAVYTPDGFLFPRSVMVVVMFTVNSESSLIKKKMGMGFVLRVVIVLQEQRNIEDQIVVMVVGTTDDWSQNSCGVIGSAVFKEGVKRTASDEAGKYSMRRCIVKIKNISREKASNMEVERGTEDLRWLKKKCGYS
ncbi:hypothetical protein Tco_1203893 [Tanacetum coccineum]